MTDVEFIVKHNEKDKNEVKERLKVEAEAKENMDGKFKKIASGDWKSELIKKRLKQKVGKKGVTREEMEEAVELFKKDFDVVVEGGVKQSSLVLKGYPFFSYEDDSEEIVSRLVWETFNSPMLPKMKGAKRVFNFIRSRGFKTWLRAKMTSTVDIVKEEEEKKEWRKELAEQMKDDLEEALNKKDEVNAEITYEIHSKSS